ncbi:MAG: hypothetical protein KAH00_01205, partial [Cocleimonas sp.]|nr:hypothetical protein [Cocleimonas sp.]
MSQNKQFIGRKDWLVRFSDYRQQQDGMIWQITGQGGIGKSTLLHEFRHQCIQAEHAHCFLELENFSLNQGVEVLQAIIQSASHFGHKKYGNWLSQAENKLDDLKQHYSEELKVAESGLQFLDGLLAGGEAVEGAKKVLDYAKNKVNNKDVSPFIQHKPEQQLLEQLALAGEFRSVLLVDTFEHLFHKQQQLNSRLDFRFQPPQEQTALKQPSAIEWLMSLFDYLQAQGWCIVIAGRAIDNQKADELQLFNSAEIKTAIQSRPVLKGYLSEYSDELLTILSILSFKGNPLWLQLAMNKLERLLQQGEQPQQLAQNPQQLHAHFEYKDPFELSTGIRQASNKLSLLQSHFHSIQGVLDLAWKLALPRFLTIELAQQLVPVEQLNSILQQFKQAGMFRHTGTLFQLHNEVRDLLLAYARDKNWEKSIETRQLHGRLWEFINQQYLDGIELQIKELSDEVLNDYSHAILEQQYPKKWVLEACYHRCLSGINLLENSISPEEFNQHFIASIASTVIKKWQTAYDLPQLDKKLLLEYLRRLTEKTEAREKLFGKQVTERLSAATAEGKVADIKDIAYWQQQVKDYGSAGDYFALTQVLVELNQQPEYLIQMVNEMLDHYGGSEQAEIQRH